jgi:CheY-like chemotaxis protein
MAGLEATGRIRALPGETGQLPIVGLTAHALQDDCERCLAAGMDRYITKPVKPETLYSTVEELLPKITHRQVVTSSGAADLSDLREALSDNREMIVDLIDKFTADWPNTCAEMNQAHADGDAAKMEHLAHNLKAVVGIFGAVRAASLAEQLERIGHSGELVMTENLLQDLESEISNVFTVLREF